MKTLLAVWHWLRPRFVRRGCCCPVCLGESFAKWVTPNDLRTRDYEECLLIRIKVDDHTFLFACHDEKSRRLLLPAAVKMAMNPELEFSGDDVANVMKCAFEAWTTEDEVTAKASEQ